MTSCHNDGPLPRSRLIRVTRNIVIGLVGTIVVAVLGASIVLQGSRLGRLIESTLPENKGKLQIGGVTWRLRALVDIVTDEPTPVSVDGLQITDPEGTVVLDVPHLDCKVKLRTLIAGGSFSIHDLRVPVALWRFAALKNSEGIGFTAALAPKVDPPPAAARMQAEGAGIVLRDRRRRDRRPERDPRLPGLMGAGAAARARAGDAEARRHRSRAPDVRVRRRAGAGGGRRLAAHPRRLRAAVRPRRDQPRRHHAGMVGRHLPGPRRGRHRPQQAGRQGLLHRHLRRDVRPRHQAARRVRPGGRRADRRRRGRRSEDRGADDLRRRRGHQGRPHRHLRRAEGEGGVPGARRQVRHLPRARHRLRPRVRRRRRARWT